MKKEKEDFEIYLKNQIIRKCRVASWLAKETIFRGVKNAANMLITRRNEKILKLRRTWAAFKLS